jgi:hypothetical protein
METARRSAGTDAPKAARTALQTTALMAGTR